MSKNIKNIRKNLVEIGDSAKKKYDETLDLKAALIAVKAYSEVTKTVIAQIRYKEKTGYPIKIKFLEENEDKK